MAKIEQLGVSGGDILPLLDNELLNPQHHMLVIAHRGASGSAPENTLRAFALALELGVGGIEFDVHATIDGSLVVIHDDALVGTTDGHGSVARKTLKELKTLDAGDKQEIPTLKEVLDLFDKETAGVTMVNVELKGANTAKSLAKIITQYVDAGKFSYNDFLVSSFDHQQLIDFKALLPMVKLGALIDKDTIFSWEEILKLEPYSINTSMEAVTAKFVRKVHDLEMKVFVYTVNKPADMIKMQNMEVDGIFSDYPERAVYKKF